MWSPSLRTHAQKHIDVKKRLKLSFFFKKNGGMHKIVRECVDDPDVFPYFFTPYKVDCKEVFGDEKIWKNVETFLAENCKEAWLPCLDGIAFVDQSDAALFILWLPELM